MRERNAALDTYKLLLSITIVVLHTSFAGKLGYLATDSLFLINGLLFSRREQEDFHWHSYFLKRLKAVYLPYLLMVTIGTVVEFAFTHNKSLLVQYLPMLLFMMPFYWTRSYVPSSYYILWYIPAYLFSVLVFSVLLEYIKKRKLDAVAIFIGIISFLSIVAKTESGGWNFSVQRGLFGVIPIGLLRSLMGYSMGYVIGRVSDSDGFSRFTAKIPEWCITMIQAAALTLSFAIMYFAPVDWIYDPPYLLLSSCLIATFAISRGWLTKLMQTVPYGISKYSASVYFVGNFAIMLWKQLIHGDISSLMDLVGVLILTAACAVIFELLTDYVRRRATCLK